MKKSTLFFKVMVLLALLVPWTAWGQTRSYAKAYDWWNDTENQRGEIFEVEITEGKEVKESLELDNNRLNEYHFAYNSKRELIQDETLPAGVIAAGDGRHDDILKLSGTAGSDLKESYTVKYTVWKGDGWKIDWDNFEDIILDGHYEKGNIGYVIVKFTVKPGIIEIPESGWEISYTGSGTSGSTKSREYNGQMISDSELKEGLVVKVTVDGNTETLNASEYEVSVIDNGTDVDKYSIKVTVKKNGYSGSTTVNDIFEITPKTITIKAIENLTAIVGEEKILTAEDFTISGNDVENDAVKLDPSISISVPTDKIGENISVQLKEGDIKVTGSNSYKESNYNIVYPETVTVNVKAKEFSDKEYAVTFEGIDGTDNSKLYDGLPIPDVSVKSKDGKTELKKGTDYEVSYQLNGNAVTESIDANTQKYAVIITGKGNYAGSSMSVWFEIKPRPLNIIAQEDAELTCKVGADVSKGWNAASYLTFKTGEKEGLVTKDGDKGRNDNAVITGTIYLAKDQTTENTGEVTLDFSEVSAGATENSTFELSNYTPSVSGLAETFKLTVSEKDLEEDTDGEVTIIPEGGEDKITIKHNEEYTMTYNGKSYSVSHDDNDKVEITCDGKPYNEEVIKNVGRYEIIVTTESENTYVWKKVTLIIEKAKLTVDVLPQTVYIHDMAALNDEGLRNTELNLGIFTEGESEDVDATIKIVSGVQADEKVSFSGTLALKADKWALGENKGTIVGEETLELAEDNVVNANYEIETVNAAALTIIYKIDNSNIDNVEIAFEGVAEGNTKVYDGTPVEVEKVTADGVIIDKAAYEVSFDNEPVNVGTYTATITFVDGSNYVVEEGSLTAKCEVTKRDLIISFSFPTPIEEGEVPTLDDAVMTVGENDLVEDETLKDCIDITFKVSDKMNANKKYNVSIATIAVKKSENEDNAFNPDNYKMSISCVGGVIIELTDEDGDGTYEGEGLEDNPVGDVVGEVETVDPETGEGSTGTFYKKYELYLANKDYLKDDEKTREHYASEDLELFSRHDKKTTWAGGSFTIWYEHNGVVNDGSYRVFWSKSKRGDYQEVKLDEVSGYYQIRNVNSDVYVKLYYETGFPVANEEIPATDARAYAQANKIVVITPEPTDVQIISMAGAVVATDQVTGQREFANLAEGVYIVRMGETVIKLQVRN